MTDSLCTKLERLNVLNARMTNLRERVAFYQNVTSFARIGGHVHDHPEEYRLYAAELVLLQKLTDTMWILQDEINDLQAEVLAEIYGSGGNAN